MHELVKTVIRALSSLGMDVTLRPDIYGEYFIAYWWVLSYLSLDRLLEFIQAELARAAHARMLQALAPMADMTSINGDPFIHWQGTSDFKGKQKTPIEILFILTLYDSDTDDDDEDDDDNEMEFTHPSPISEPDNDETSDTSTSTITENTDSNNDDIDSDDQLMDPTLVEESF